MNLRLPRVRQYPDSVAVGALRLCLNLPGATHFANWQVQTPLFCALIDLLDEGTDVTAPEDIVYSTKPKKATGADGNSYYVKGPDLNIVAAEAVAHQLAEGLDIRVPDFGIAIPPGGNGPLFASREVGRCQRQVENWVLRNKTTNKGLLPIVAAFDVWVMNKDRNIGNLVGEGQTGPAAGKISLIAIDFEKSMALRGPYPLTTTSVILPRSLWPSGTLGHLLAGENVPHDFCAAMERATEDLVLNAFARVEAVIGDVIPWKESSAKLLASRARKIRTLVAEVWR